MRSPDDELAALQSASLLRQLRPVNSPQLSHCTVGQTQLLNFASNDYLGLATHPQIIEAFQQGVSRWGAGSGASRLICGSLTPHRQLEEALAEAKNTEAALSFANGYATSVGTLSALLRKGDTVILDKLSHASLIDGARLSGATIRVFPHNDLNKLEKLLQICSRKSSADSRILVVTESVFSMDGDTAPLGEIVALKQKYNALLLVDEAHAFGVYGKSGMGLAEHLGCGEGIDLHMGTLGKAAGVAGGYIAGRTPLIQLLINHARSFIYSTASPPAQAVASLAALQLIRSQEGHALRKTLWNNLDYFATLTHTNRPSSAIIPWLVGESAASLTLSQNLQSRYAILAPAIRFPTVPRNTARLRITLTAQHSKADIDQLCSALSASSDGDNS